MRAIRISLYEETPMQPEDIDFSVLIDFKKGEGNPRRVFDAASLLIEGFERLDRAVISSIDNKIGMSLMLEDIEAGSIKIFLKNVLKETDDDALKKLDWKPQVGKYLVKAKYAALKYLDSKGDDNTPKIEDLSTELQAIAQETDVLLFSAYAPVNEAKLITALDKFQDAKKQLSVNDRLYLESEAISYEIDIHNTWSPTATLSPDAKRETYSHGEMILIVRKPDMIGNTMWQFQHGKTNIYAPIKDDEWLSDYHDRKIDIRPSDAIRCWVRFIYIYDNLGTLEEQKIEIEQVKEIIITNGFQHTIFE